MPATRKPKTASVPLQAAMFDRIASGAKRTEVREATPYWRARLIGPGGAPARSITFTRGYSRRRATYAVDSLRGVEYDPSDPTGARVLREWPAAETPVLDRDAFIAGLARTLEAIDPGWGAAHDPDGLTFRLRIPCPAGDPAAERRAAAAEGRYFAAHPSVRVLSRTRDDEALYIAFRLPRIAYEIAIGPRLDPEPAP